MTEASLAPEFKVEFIIMPQTLKFNMLDADQVKLIIAVVTTMIKRIQEMVGEAASNWQVSLEERMACGVGVCMGCGVKMNDDGYRMVCSDGPVFNLREIVFDG